MDRNKAFNRRGSGHPYGQGHRPSISWTVKERIARSEEDRAPEEGDDGKKDEKKEKEKEGNTILGKEIGLLYGGSLVMNAIIGPGIFGTPKGVLAGVGSVGMCIAMWTFAGIFSMCAALCFAELRESVKREGVEYAYITEAFGPLAGHVYSWMRIAAAEPTSTAVFALAFTDYIADAIYDKCGPPKLFIIIVATLATLSMALINLMSTKLSEKFQNLAIVGKVCALCVVVIMGIKRMIDGHVEVIDEGLKGTTWSPTNLAFALYNALWAYGGWSNVNHVTSGIKKPPRNVPRVVKTILPCVLVIYILVVLSYFSAMTREELLHSRAIGVTWAERVLGPASSIISIGVGLTALGSLNATFLSAGRLSGVAAKNGQMPDVASWVHVRSKTPVITLALRCVIAVMVMCVATGQELLRFYIFIVWLFHGSSIVALLFLRYKNKHKKRPYKVDLWIPVLVVIVITYLLLAPFFEKPEKEFIAALALIGFSVLSYWPINWIKSRDVVSVPDKLTIWLQLLLRIAPKRDLRRERRSMMRRMSMFARDSILITPNVLNSPDMMRRFSRRMSRISRIDGSPALIRRMGDDQPNPNLRRRMNRGNSLAEADIIKRGRSNSMWAFGSETKPSPAIIRKKPNRNSHSFNHADVATLKSPPSLPILKNRFNTTPASTEDSKPGSQFELPLNTNNLHPPHQPVSHKPSPIPEEDPPGPLTPIESNAEDARSSESQQEEDLQVIADFESDGGGSYEVLAHPHDVRRMSLEPQVVLTDTESDSSSSTDSDSSKSDKSNILKNSIFASLFAHSNTSSSSSDSESSIMDEDGFSEDDVDLPPLPTFYYSDELESDFSDDGNKTENEDDGEKPRQGFYLHLEDEQLQQPDEQQQKEDEQEQQQEEQKTSNVPAELVPHTEV